MLHDSLIPQDHGHETTDDRRQSPRTAQRAELVVRWHHAPDTPVRYRVLDVGDGGVRILSALPLLRGLSGTAITLLPKGEPINRPCSVSWARPPAMRGPFEIGLNFT
ncbi:MAG: PilZ domain-containing protein [Planctomycetes bacterium]|nr:PilZ domain-containing protein [Planctomycetota bacterium]